MWQLTRRFALTAVLASASGLVAPGCSSCVIGSKSTGRQCNASGGATLATAPGLVASKPLYVSYGMSCFNGANCLAGLSVFLFDTIAQNSAPRFDMQLNLPAISGDFTVSPPPVTADWNPIGPPGGQLEPLTVQSGTVAVQGASAAGFTASFAVELRTSDGQPISVTDGLATVANCREVESCGE